MTIINNGLVPVPTSKTAVPTNNSLPAAKDDGDVDSASPTAKATTKAVNAPNSAVILSLSPAAKAIVSGSTSHPATLTAGTHDQSSSKTTSTGKLNKFFNTFTGLKSRLTKPSLVQTLNNANSLQASNRTIPTFHKTHR